jgi:hypothetical protein
MDKLNAFIAIAIGVNNHIRLTWEALANYTLLQIQASFMKFIAQQLKHSMIKNDNDLPASLKVNKQRYPFAIINRTNCRKLIICN